MPDLSTCLKPPPRLSPVVDAALLKTQCEDFQVTEIPAYEPAGIGEHLFLKIQKRDVSAAQLLKVLSHQLRISQRDIGIAGQKDRRAVTTQFVSVPARSENRVVGFQHEQIRILETTPHGNKLRTGHLLGNRFRIVLRPEADEFTSGHLFRVRQSLASCETNGFPNYYGRQRFGIDGSSVTKGLQLVSGSASDRKAIKASRFERKMLFSAVQAAAFNIVTAARVSDNSIGVPTDGDVVCRRAGIRPFLFSHRNTDSTDQLVPMGPMFGSKMLAAEGATRSLELEALQTLGLTEERFDSRKDTPGARRPMLAWPIDTTCELCGDGNLILQFELSAGTYATVLLAEIFQNLIEPGS